MSFFSTPPPSSNTFFGPSSNFLCGTTTPSTTSLFGVPQTGRITSNSVSLFTPSNNVLDDLFRTVHVYVKREDERAAIDASLATRHRARIIVSTLDTLLPYEIAIPNDGPFKTFCFCMPGVDVASLSVELDQTSRRILRITGSADSTCKAPTMAPFTIDRAAPEHMRFVLARENISLVQGILSIRYTLESCHDFQKIF